VEALIRFNFLLTASFGGGWKEIMELTEETKQKIIKIRELLRKNAPIIYYKFVALKKAKATFDVGKVKKV